MDPVRRVCVRVWLMSRASCNLSVPSLVDGTMSQLCWCTQKETPMVLVTSWLDPSPDLWYTNCHFLSQFPKPQSHSGPSRSSHQPSQIRSVSIHSRLRKSLTCLMFPSCSKPKVGSTPIEHEIWINEPWTSSRETFDTQLWKTRDWNLSGPPLLGCPLQFYRTDLTNTLEVLPTMKNRFPIDTMKNNCWTISFMLTNPVQCASDHTTVCLLSCYLSRRNCTELAFSPPSQLVVGLKPGVEQISYTSRYLTHSLSNKRSRGLDVRGIKEWHGPSTDRWVRAKYWPVVWIYSNDRDCHNSVLECEGSQTVKLFLLLLRCLVQPCSSSFVLVPEVTKPFVRNTILVWNVLVLLKNP